MLAPTLCSPLTSWFHSLAFAQQRYGYERPGLHTLNLMLLNPAALRAAPGLLSVVPDGLQILGVSANFANRLPVRDVEPSSHKIEVAFGLAITAMTSFMLTDTCMYESVVDRDQLMSHHAPVFVAERRYHFVILRRRSDAYFVTLFG